MAKQIKSATGRTVRVARSVEDTAKHLDEMGTKGERVEHLNSLPRDHVAVLYDHLADHPGASNGVPHSEIVDHIADGTGKAAAAGDAGKSDSGKSSYSSALGASKDAEKASEKARSSGDPEDHKAAAAAHREAGEARVLAGDPPAGRQHFKIAGQHEAFAAGNSKAFETGAKGGSFYLTKTGRRVYRKQ